jgi:hypothetical protein
VGNEVLAKSMLNRGMPCFWFLVDGRVSVFSGHKTC